ncbi:MAG: NADPH:quinone oxidoreductase family protein [Hyphomonadaceae bacterium]
MRAVVGQALGAPENYHLVEVEAPTPPAGCVRIRVAAVGVSFVDVLIAAGGYQMKPPTPFVPGSGFSGVIDAVGEEVPVSRIGERVSATHFGGGFAEHAIAFAQAALVVPDDMPLDVAAIFPGNYATAHYALAYRAMLRLGETVLVLGAAGNVGLAAIEVGKALGARVIASASSAAKRELALASGADAAIDSGASDWRDQVKALTQGRGADVVVDPVGGEATERAFRSLAWNGRLLVVGFAEGAIPRVPANLALLKGASLVGVDLRQFAEKEPAQAAANVSAVFALYQQGKLGLRIDRRFALADFREAMHASTDRSGVGRVLIEVASGL